MKIKVNGTSISASERCSLTEGNINSLYVDFEYSPEWENLIKTAVFANGTASISIPITASRHAIPWEVLAHTGELYVSLRGSTEGGNVVRTTGNAFLGRVQSSLAAVIVEATPNVIDVLMAEVANHEERITELEEHSGGAHPYLSLERRGSYLYEVSFADIPAFAGGDGGVIGGCSSYVKDGKLYRNLDWDYSELASFHVVCKGFEGMAFTPGLTDTELDDALIGQLPYRIVDGCNDYGIRVATHVLFNDWQWQGSGDTPLYKLPYIILSSINTLDNLSTQLADVLGDLYATPTLTDADYLLQFLVTDGVTTYAILPPESASEAYTVVDITANPKLANFRWVADAVVDRADLQERPTGVERWNMMPCELSDLRFTKAYEAPDRLSEFIGIDGTDKDSTDAELEEIYNTARAEYLTRTRNGLTWQTMHSVVYGENGIEHLWVQENWAKDYVCHGTGGGGDIPPEVENAIATGGIGWTETNGYNITWDGVIGDRDVATLSGYQYARVADYMTPEELDGAVLTVDYGGGTSSFPMDYLSGNAVTNADGNTLYYNDADPALLTAEAAGVYVSGAIPITVPSAGVYFISTGEPYAYSLAKGTETVHKIDEKYLPDIPTQLSQLTGDSTHRTVTDAEKAAWNGKEATTNRLGTVNPSADSIATGKYYSAAAVSAFLDKLIPHYVSAHSWSVGDYCTFGGTIYKCNTAHSNVQWTSAYWDAVPDFSKDLVDTYALKDDLDELQKTALTATVTIAVADWEDGTTVVKSVTGVTASNIVICDSSDADVQCTAQGAGTLTFTASATPSAEVTVKVVILP